MHSWETFEYRAFEFSHYHTIAASFYVRTKASRVKFSICVSFLRCGNGGWIRNEFESSERKNALNCSFLPLIFCHLISCLFSSHFLLAPFFSLKWKNYSFFLHCTAQILCILKLQTFFFSVVDSICVSVCVTQFSCLLRWKVIKNSSLYPEISFYFHKKALEFIRSLWQFPWLRYSTSATSWVFFSFAHKHTNIFAFSFSAVFFSFSFSTDILAACL